MSTSTVTRVPALPLLDRLRVAHRAAHGAFLWHATDCPLFELGRYCGECDALELTAQATGNALDAEQDRLDGAA